MRLLLLAPPGAGKGTQAERLTARYGCEHIASGDLLRREIAAQTELGKAADSYVRAGDLVPDELLLDLVAARVFAASAAGGYVLDGWPRNLSQAEAAYRLASSVEAPVTLQAVLHLSVERDELVRRMLERAATQGRADDTDGTIAHRLDVYDRLTEPLLDFYGERGILHRVDGSRPVDEVTDAIVELLDGAGLAV